MASPSGLAAATPAATPQWKDAVVNTLSDDATASSFPHRSLTEIADLASGFLGATTWQAVCRAFGIDFDRLPDTVQSEAP